MSAITYRKAGFVTADVAYGFRIALAGFVAVVVACYVVVGIVVATTGTLDAATAQSVWEHSAYATRYFPLSLGIMLTGIYLSVGVANGVTRTSISLGCAAVVLVIAGAMAVLEGLGYLVEHALYSLNGADVEYNTPHLFDSGTQIWISVPEVWITVAGNVAAGWLIGTAYYRWGWFGPTLALPLTFAPALAVEALMSVGWPGGLMIDAWGVERAPLWLAITGSLLIIALTLLGTSALVRRLPVRPAQA